MLEAVHYSLDIHAPHAHLFRTTMTLANAKANQIVSLPNWIPGSYKIRDFAKNIVRIEASVNGFPVKPNQLNKNTWDIPCEAGDKVTITTECYAWDLSVRGCHVDASHALINGTQAFLCAKGFEEAPCVVAIHKPENVKWKIATSLDLYRPLVIARGEAPKQSQLDCVGPAGLAMTNAIAYQADNYDALIDSPIELSDFQSATFEAAGIPHTIAITGRANIWMDKLKGDLQKICEAQIDFFGEFPENRYTFITLLVNDGYGGLEHRASTSLMIARKCMPYQGMPADSEDYATFLSLASHEYFHTWNIKRIKPEAFLPYDLEKENYTRQLWIFEGFTSYFEDMFLVRAGVVTLDRFFKLFADKMTSVLNNPGHLVQSLKDSSFNAWDKFYDPNENSPNAIVSYYSKGAMIAFIIDTYLRVNTSHTLDEVMRHLWTAFGKPKIGVPEGYVEQYLSNLTNGKIDALLSELINDAKPIPIQEYAKLMGVSFAYTAKDSKTLVELGIKLVPNTCDVALVYSDGAAVKAGLSAGDKIVAINHLSLAMNPIDELLKTFKPGDLVTVHAFRRDELKVFEVAVAPKRANEVKLGLMACEGDVLARREQWLC